MIEEGARTSEIRCTDRLVFWLLLVLTNISIKTVLDKGNKSEVG
jgi:hypothetical protein